MALDTVNELLAAVDRLPEPDRLRAQARVADALEQPAGACRAALGLLALDLLDVLDLDLVAADAATNTADTAGGPDASPTTRLSA